MQSLYKNDLRFIANTLKGVMDECKTEMDSIPDSEGGTKRVYAMQIERSQRIIDTLQKAFDTNAKRIAIK